MMKRLNIIILLLILVLGFGARFYRFNGPVADWHSWRQADTASVTRNFVEEGFTPMFPKYDTLNPLNDPPAPNPNRYFLAEFPIYNTITYFGFTIFHHFTIEEWGRIVSIIFSTLTILFLYLLVRIHSSERVALLSALFFALIPYNIYYGRTILPDPLHVFGGIAALFFISKWVKSGNWTYSIFGAIFWAICILTKPYGLVLALPIAFLIWNEWGINFIKKKALYIFGILAIIPYILWNHHISQHPEGMFSTIWLFNAGNIRFTGAYFRWIIFDRMNRLIFSTGGFVLFFIGLIRGYEKKEEIFYYSWLLSILVFFVIIAKGNVTHDYYQLPLVPIGAIFIARGVDFLISYRTGMQRILNTGIALCLVLMMFAFGWFEVRGYFNINNPAIVIAGKTADQILPKDAKVIAPYDNDPAFLYQTDRQGWTVGADRIPEFIKAGATDLISVNYDDTTRMWMNKCTVVREDPQFVIVDLKNCKE